MGPVDLSSATPPDVMAGHSVRAPGVDEHATVAATPDGAAAFWPLGALSGASCALAGAARKVARRRRVVAAS